MKTFAKFYTLLKEGGNLFPEITDDIEREDVIPTVKYLETITGLPLIDNLLGSTGKAEKSGDIDVGVDAAKMTKDELISILVNQKISPAEPKKPGILVGFACPVYNIENKLTDKFVQVDFMFHDDLKYLKWFFANNEALPLKGKDRNILFSSIAKNKNLKISVNGLSNRETDLLITRDPNIIAKKLLDDKATKKDLHNIPSIMAALKRIYKDENIIKQIVASAEISSGVRYI